MRKLLIGLIVVLVAATALWLVGCGKDDGGASGVPTGIAKISPIVPSSVTSAITVTSPNGGEVWADGNAHDITWKSTLAGNHPTVAVSYSVDNGSTWVLIDNSVNATQGNSDSGSKSWTIPCGVTAAGTAKVKVQSNSTSDVDASDAGFTIVSCPAACTGNGQSGTTSSATVDGGGLPTCFNYFDWSFTKSMNHGPYTICKDGSIIDTATICATKTQHTGFTGEVCVTNGGGVAFEGLRITVTLMINCGGGTGYDPYMAPVVVDLGSYTTLAPGASHCYPYTIETPTALDPSSTCTYRVDADVSITNHSGNLCERRSINPKSNSGKFTCQPSNGCVTVSDVSGGVTTPDAVDVSGWNISPNPTTLTFCNTDESLCQSVYVTITNNGVPNEHSFTATNTIQLDGEVVASDTVALNTTGCSPPPPPGGCSRTIGFYKTHAVANLYGRNQDWVSTYLPISLGDGGPKTLVVTSNTQVVSIMQDGDNSNGIVKLYKQLLAAKLNILGAGNSDHTPSDGTCIAATIAAADAFLGTHNAADWSGLTKSERNDVLGWQGMLDQYNNGLLCANHCD